MRWATLNHRRTSFANQYGESSRHTPQRDTVGVRGVGDERTQLGNDLGEGVDDALLLHCPVALGASIAAGGLASSPFCCTGHRGQKGLARVACVVRVIIGWRQIHWDIALVFQKSRFLELQPQLSAHHDDATGIAVHTGNNETVRP